MLIAVTMVALGGALGTLTRFGTVALMHQTFGNNYPIGTWIVNSLGSFLAGVVMIIILERMTTDGEHWRLFTMVGFMGGYTTFSSYAWETWLLYQQGDWFAALLNVVLNNFCALLLVVLGVMCGRWINSAGL